MADPADIQRLVGDLARIGVVQSVDQTNATARVAIGDLLTGDIPWVAARVGATRVWSPPSVGEQVLVLCPEGDTAAGLIVGSLSSDANPHAGSDSSSVIVFADGASIDYDPEAHALAVMLPTGGTARVAAPGGIVFECDVEIKGGLTIDGQVYATDSIHSDGDVTANTVSLQHHVHDKVQAGTAISGKPIA
ncbi:MULTISPECIES: phage baseplate assembly protein V [unclassified Sphingomonas]|uniref:phage baseplate assembly protein V n=1 Tax=unclassified Sphingomonas TaxID=196159 RepID=UPI0022698957|nr:MULTISPECIES: phage baseplate assembly protein V [unclassified Sphingomonas]